MREPIAHALASSEARLLVACARGHVDRVSAARIGALAGEVRDWPALLALARRHRMVPLLYQHLGAKAADAVPHPVSTQLREAATANTARNLALATELLAVMQLLAARDVCALPYKGSTLAVCVYGSLALREMKDLDILIAGRDLDRAVAALGTRGYRPVARASRAVRALGLEYQCELARSADGARIELHWMVVPRNMAPPITIDELWPRRLHTSVLGTTVPTPSHEDMLVILAVHGAKHGWARLEWICGVAELVRSKPLDWIAVLSRAERSRAMRMLSTGLLLATDLFQAPVPDFILTFARADADAVALADSVASSLFAAGDPPLSPRELRAFQLRLQERMPDKLRYVCVRPMIAGARKGAGLARRIRLLAAR